MQFSKYKDVDIDSPQKKKTKNHLLRALVIGIPTTLLSFYTFKPNWVMETTLGVSFTIISFFITVYYLSYSRKNSALEYGGLLLCSVLFGLSIIINQPLLMLASLIIFFTGFTIALCKGITQKKQGKQHYKYQKHYFNLFIVGLNSVLLTLWIVAFALSIYWLISHQSHSIFIYPIANIIGLVFIAIVLTLATPTPTNTHSHSTQSANSLETTISLKSKMQSNKTKVYCIQPVPPMEQQIRDNFAELFSNKSNNMSKSKTNN